MVVEMDWSAGTGSLHTTTADGDVLLTPADFNWVYRFIHEQHGLVVRLGSDANSANLDGAIAGVIVYESVLSASDRFHRRGLPQREVRPGGDDDPRCIGHRYHDTGSHRDSVVTNSVTASIATAPSATGTVAVETGRRVSPGRWSMPRPPPLLRW